MSDVFFLFPWILSALIGIGTKLLSNAHTGRKKRLGTILLIYSLVGPPIVGFTARALFGARPGERTDLQWWLHDKLGWSLGAAENFQGVAPWVGSVVLVILSMLVLYSVIEDHPSGAEVPRDASKPLPKGWLVVALLWPVVCLGYLDRRIITSVHDSLGKAIPMTHAQFGLLLSVFVWGFGILSPFAGFLADRLNRSRVIIVSLLVLSAATLLTGHARNFEQLLIARAFVGISSAAYFPAALALITDYHRGSTRSLAIGAYMTGTTVSFALDGVGASLTANSHDWSFPFSIYGIIGIASAVVLLFTLRDVPPMGNEIRGPSLDSTGKVKFLDALVSLFRQPSFLLLLTSWGLLGLASWAVTMWMPSHFFHLLRWTPKTGPVVINPANR